jgi:hypothetical protein
MVFDSGRGLTIGVDLIGVNAYSYDGHAWSLISLGAQQDFPPGNFSGGLVYDAAHETTLLMPGSSAAVFDTPLTGLYSLTSDGWKALTWTGSSPPPSYRAMGAFDPSRGRTIFLIETDTDPWQTWEWTGSAWEQGPSLPNAEPDSFTFDTVRGVGFVSGVDPTSHNEAVWVYTPSATAAKATWSSVPITGDVYNGLIDSPLVFDPLRDRVIRCTGKFIDSLLGYSDEIEVWSWAQSTWIRTNYSDDLPYADRRASPAAAYDLNRDVLVLYGGYTYSIVNGVGTPKDWTDTWEQQVLDVLYVAASNTGTQDGSAAHPFATVHQAAAAINGCIRAISIQAGNYAESPLTINTPVLLQAPNGPATLR